MKKADLNEDQNINRRNFLKKITLTAVFTVPTITSFQLLAKGGGKSDWTAHGHGNRNSAPLPPPPPGS